MNLRRAILKRPTSLPGAGELLNIAQTGHGPGIHPTQVSYLDEPLRAEGLNFRGAFDLGSVSERPITTVLTRAKPWTSPPDWVVGGLVPHQQIHHPERCKQGRLDLDLCPRLPPTWRPRGLGESRTFPYGAATGAHVRRTLPGADPWGT